MLKDAEAHLHLATQELSYYRSVIDASKEVLKETFTIADQLQVPPISAYLSPGTNITIHFSFDMAQQAVADLGGFRRFQQNPLLATELRKVLLWLTLACFSRKFVQNLSIGLVGLVVVLKAIKMGVVLTESGCGFCNFARLARKNITESPFNKS